MKEKRATPGVKARVLANGNIVYDAYFDGPRRANGYRRKTWKRGFRSAAEASRWRRKQLVLRDEGNLPDVSRQRQTLGDYLEEWLRTTVAANCRPSTSDSYARLIKQYVQPRLGAIKLRDLDASTLDRFYGELLTSGRRNGAGLSPRTVRYAHTIVRKALKDAVRKGLLARNVADQADPPKSKSPEMKTWNADQVKTFLETVRNDRLFALWRVAVTTGLRRSELAGLAWRHVDLDAARISVRRTLLVIGYELSYGEPKTLKGRRSVSIDGETVVALRQLKLVQEQERLALGLGRVSDPDPVFADITGKHIHPEAMGRMFAVALRTSGLPRIRFHDLRHTHATLGLTAGVHPKVMSERLGHASVVITLDTYSHAIPWLQEEAAERMAALLA